MGVADDDLPDDWFEEHDGQSLVLSEAKVKAEIHRLRRALELIAGSTTDKLQEMHARAALDNIGP